MANFKEVDLGSFAEIGNLKENEILPRGKVFLRDKLGLTSSEISINSAAPGTKAPYGHRHKQNEEIYIFLKGMGIMSIDGHEFDVREGSCVVVKPEGCRYLENTGTTNLDYICIQAKEDSLEQSLFDDGDICEPTRK